MTGYYCVGEPTMAKHMKAASPQAAGPQAASSQPAALQSEMFFWERKGLDFPFYNDKNMGLWQPILLIASAVVPLLLLQYLPDSRLIKSLFLCLAPLVPFLIVARGNIFTIVKRPRLGDIPLVIVTLILTIAFGIGVAAALYNLGFEIQGNAVYNEARDEVFFRYLAIQLFGEEMIKINIFLGVLILAFKRSGNRKASILVAIVLTLFIFGLAHLRAYNGAVLQILLIQGLGSIFDLFCYLRTKNILTSYAMHLIQDAMFLV